MPHKATDNFPARRVPENDGVITTSAARERSLSIRTERYGINSASMSRRDVLQAGGVSEIGERCLRFNRRRTQPIRRQCVCQTQFRIVTARRQLRSRSSTPNFAFGSSYAWQSRSGCARYLPAAKPRPPTPAQGRTRPREISPAAAVACWRAVESPPIPARHPIRAAAVPLVLAFRGVLVPSMRPGTRAPVRSGQRNFL